MYSLDFLEAEFDEDTQFAEVRLRYGVCQVTVNRDMLVDWMWGLHWLWSESRIHEDKYLWASVYNEDTPDDFGLTILKTYSIEPWEKEQRQFETPATVDLARLQREDWEGFVTSVRTRDSTTPGPTVLPPYRSIGNYQTRDAIRDAVGQLNRLYENETESVVLFGGDVVVRLVETLSAPAS